MKTLALILSLLLSVTVPVLASSDWFGDLRKVSFSFVDNAKNPVEVTLTFKATKYFFGFQPPTKILTAIEVVYHGRTIVIPQEELEGISNIQMDTIAFRNGTYRQGDGSSYCYIEALFGPPMKECEDGFERVWFLMQEDYQRRETFASLPHFFKRTSVKEKGKPIKKSEGGADQPATSPESKPESKEKPQPESKPASR